MVLQCRSCLTTSPIAEYISLTSTLSTGITFFDFFNQCTQLRATGHDGLPHIVCSSCTHQLQVAYNFVRTAQKSDAKLREQLSAKNTDDVEEQDVMHLDVLQSVEEEECIVEELVEVDEDGMEVMQVERVEEHLLDDSVDLSAEYLIEKSSLEEVQEADELQSIRDEDSPVYYPEDEVDDEYLKEYEELVSDDSNSSANVNANVCWKCLVCKSFLCSDVSYEGHMNLHKNVRPYKCIECECAFRCKNALMRHASLRHQMKVLGQRFVCELCQKVFRLQTLLEQHQFQAHQEAVFICTICSETFYSASALDEHQLSQHSNTTEVSTTTSADAPKSLATSWECGICQKRFRSANNLRLHMCSVHTQPTNTTEVSIVELDEEVQCELCKRNLLRRNFEKHMALHARKEREAAEGNSKFSCAYCSRECKNKKTLYQHEKMHEGESPLVVYVCSDCDRQYNTAYLLQHHRKMAHKDRDHVCNICGNAFKLKNQLMNHMKLHLEKNIQCPECDKKYARQVDLNVHMRSHTGELPYACHLCDRRFAIKVRLTYHLQKHNGVKHGCRECGAEFNSKQKLKAHSFKHTGMPYRCETCNDHGFANRDVFKRHLARVHSKTMTDDELVEMFQRNTGKTTRIRRVSEADNIVLEESVDFEEQDMEQA